MSYAHEAEDDMVLLSKIQDEEKELGRISLRLVGLFLVQSALKYPRVKSRQKTSV